MADKKINIERIMRRLKRLGQIGREEDGAITRLAFSNEQRSGSELAKQWMEEAGLETRTDELGNVTGLKRGNDPNKKILCIGSHLDTVRKGGLYDGALGVLAAIECAQAMNENHICPEHPILIAGFNAEEGGPLGGTFGSRAMLGLVDTNRDANKLRNAGISGEQITKSVINFRQIQSYLELHIEQGPKLEAEKKNIGIVSGIVGITRMKIVAVGESNHAGTTGMRERRDALVAISKLIVMISDMAKKMGDGFVATVGEIRIEPNMANVIPGNAEASLEIRSLEQTKIKELVHHIRKRMGEIEDAGISIELIVEKSASFCDERVMDIIKGECEKENESYMIMPSGAGHDANSFAKRAPTGMIFVPSRGGKSHCREEFTSKEQIERGTHILYRTLLQLDKGS